MAVEMGGAVSLSELNGSRARREQQMARDFYTERFGVQDVEPPKQEGQNSLNSLRSQGYVVEGLYTDVTEVVVAETGKVPETKPVNSVALFQRQPDGSYSTETVFNVRKNKNPNRPALTWD